MIFAIEVDFEDWTERFFTTANSYSDLLRKIRQVYSDEELLHMNVNCISNNHNFIYVANEDVFKMLKNMNTEF